MSAWKERKEEETSNNRLRESGGGGGRTDADGRSGRTRTVRTDDDEILAPTAFFRFASLRRRRHRRLDHSR